MGNPTPSYAPDLLATKLLALVESSFDKLLDSESRDGPEPTKRERREAFRAMAEGFTGSEPRMRALIDSIVRIAHKNSSYRRESASNPKPCACADCQSSAHRSSLRRQNAVSLRRRQLTNDPTTAGSSFGDDGSSAGPSSSPPPNAAAGPSTASSRLSGLPAPSADNTLAALLSRHIARAGRADPPVDWEMASEYSDSDSDGETIDDSQPLPPLPGNVPYGAASAMNARMSAALSALRQARSRHDQSLSDFEASARMAAAIDPTPPPPLRNRTPYASPPGPLALPLPHPQGGLWNFSPRSRSPTLYSPSAAEADADGWISVGSSQLQQQQLGLASPPPSSTASGSRTNRSSRHLPRHEGPSLAGLAAAATAEDAADAHLLDTLHLGFQPVSPPRSGSSTAAAAAVPPVDWEALEVGLTVDMLDAAAGRRASRRRAEEEGVWADEPERRRTPAPAAAASFLEADRSAGAAP